MGVVSTWNDGMKVIKNLKAFGRTREHYKCKTVGRGCGFNRCKCFAFLPKKTRSDFGQVFSVCLFFSLIVKIVCVRAIIDDENPTLIYMLVWANQTKAETWVFGFFCNLAHLL